MRNDFTLTLHLSQVPPAHQEQFGAQYLAQGHFDTQAGIRTRDPLITRRPREVRGQQHTSHLIVFLDTKRQSELLIRKYFQWNDAGVNTHTHTHTHTHSHTHTQIHKQVELHE